MMYHFVADICRRAESGESLKKCLYQVVKTSKFREKLPSIRALVDTTLRNRVTVDELINQTNLSNEILFNEVWIARVLVAELVFGKKSYRCFDKVSKKVYQYKKVFKSIAGDAKKKGRTFIPHYCRINTLNCIRTEFHEMLSSQFSLKVIRGRSEVTYKDFLQIVRNLKENEYIQDYHLADLYIFHPKAKLIILNLYRENKIILQDKSSCLVAPLLSPTPGSIMLDMCAAPGYKTQHLSSISATSGLILAVDINKERYITLRETKIKYKLTNVMTFNADSLHLPELATKCIEYILLDAPCSGSGVVQNYDYGADERKEKTRLNKLHNLQCYLLRSALTQYASARKVVYSTCSINEEENEAVIDELLNIAKENDFILVNLKNHYQDLTTGLSKYTCGNSCIRLIPEQSCTNGFFIALFERSNPANAIPRTEFYKNLNFIIANMVVKKNNKASETELDNNNSVQKGKEASVKRDFKDIKQKHEQDKILETAVEEVIITEDNFVNVESSDDEIISVQDDEIEPLSTEKNYIRVIPYEHLKEPSIVKDGSDDNKNKIRLTNVPYTDGENLFNVIKVICRQINFNIKEKDLELCYRLESKELSSGAPIIFEFVRTEIKDKFIRTFLSKKHLVNTNLFLDVKLDLPTQIIISEFVDTETFKLFKEAKSLKKEGKIKFVWIRNGKLFVRKEEGEKVVLINSEVDLQTICDKSSVELENFFSFSAGGELEMEEADSGSFYCSPQRIKRKIVSEKKSSKRGC